MVTNMLSHLLIKRDGQIFIQAAGGDSHERVRRRAARIALRVNKPVNYQLINRRNEYLLMDVYEARIIMTPTAWIEELRDCFSDPLSRKEIKQLKERVDFFFIKTELVRERTASHKQCLRVDKEIARVTKMMSV